MLEVYVNGRIQGKDVSYVESSSSETLSPDLLFGGAGTSGNQYWGMCIDDFAVWNGHKLTNDEIVYIMNKGGLYSR